MILLSNLLCRSRQHPSQMLLYLHQLPKRPHRQPLVAINDWLVHRAEWLVGVFALLLGVYLAWQGLEGLHQMAALSAA